MNLLILSNWKAEQKDQPESLSGLQGKFKLLDTLVSPWIFGSYICKLLSRKRLDLHHVESLPNLNEALGLGFNSRGG